MSTDKILIIGGGIAGPVLAIFLKLKGYNPIIYDRLDGVFDVGNSLLIQPNGTRILAQIPGLLDKLPASTVDNFKSISTLVEGKEEIMVDMGSQVPTGMSKQVSLAMKPVIRAQFLRTTVQYALDLGVEIKWGHKLSRIEQGEIDDPVRVFFENGASDVGAFVVGCDGLNSNTRKEIFGPVKADYTGLTQTSGISPAPSELGESYSWTQWYGNGTHMLMFRPSKELAVWAITRREPESREDWKTVDDINEANAIKAELTKKWTHGLPRKLIDSAGRILKHGCYDRPALETWHKGRVTLLGDAAHPTSPHIGQGANQAFEDAHELVRSLVVNNPDRANFSAATLEKALSEYEKTRIPRSAEMVVRARKGGESLVVEGFEACSERNEAIKAQWSDARTRLENFRKRIGEAPVDLMSL